MKIERGGFDLPKIIEFSFECESDGFQDNFSILNKCLDEVITSAGTLM